MIKIKQISTKKGIYTVNEKLVLLIGDLIINLSKLNTKEQKAFDNYINN